MRSFILNVALNTASEIDVEYSLDEYYRLLDCDMIDVRVCMIGEISYDIICDDEALHKSDPIVSALDEDWRPALYGSLLFLHHDENGMMTELTKDDISNLADHVMVITSPEELKGRMFIAGVRW